MTNSAKHIFLSYSAFDRPYAEKLKIILDQFGYDVWMDLDTALRGVWHSEIESKLSTASCVLVLWSKRSVASTWVRYEAAHAIGRNVYVGCRIENRISLPSPLDARQDATLYGWLGDTQFPGFVRLLECLTELVGEPQNTAPRVVLFEKPWPERIPRPVREVVWTWVYQNLVAISALVASLLTVFVVYRALNSQLVDLRNATHDVVQAGEKGKETLRTLGDRVDTIGSVTKSLQKNVDKLQSQISNVSNTAGQLSKEMTFVSRAASLTAKESTSVNTLTLAFLVKRRDQLNSKTFGDPGVAIGHAGLHLAHFRIDGAGSLAKRRRLLEEQTYKGVMNGVIRFHSKAEYPLGETDERYSLIEALRFDRLPNQLPIRAVTPALSGPDNPIFQPCIELRINTWAMTGWIRNENADLTRIKDQPNGSEPTAYTMDWPIALVRDLRTMSIRCPVNICSAMIIGVNDDMWTAANSDMLPVEETGMVVWSDIGEQLIERGVYSQK